MGIVRTHGGFPKLWVLSWGILYLRIVVFGVYIGVHHIEVQKRITKVVRNSHNSHIQPRARDFETNVQLPFSQGNVSPFFTGQHLNGFH